MKSPEPDGTFTNKKRFLVVGDVFIDRAWLVKEGTSLTDQIRDGIVPIKLLGGEKIHSTDVLGGAGSVVRALLANFDVDVTLVGVWPSTFQPGGCLHISPAGQLSSVSLADVPFLTCKWRVYHRMPDGTANLSARYDHDLATAPIDSISTDVLGQLQALEYDAVIVADYNKGVIRNSAVLKMLGSLRVRKAVWGKPFLIRPKMAKTQFGQLKTLCPHWTILLPNLEGLFSLLDTQVPSDVMRLADPSEGKATLLHPELKNALNSLDLTKDQAVILKLGAMGALLFECAPPEHKQIGFHIGAEYRGPWSAIGAGDNLAAALAYRLAIGDSLQEAAISAVRFATQYCRNAHRIEHEDGYGVPAEVDTAECSRVAVNAAPVRLEVANGQELFISDAQWALQGFTCTGETLMNAIAEARRRIESYVQASRMHSGRPLLLAICGGPGSGKSTLARGLATATRCTFRETNVAQWTTFEALSDLCEQLRDDNLRGEVPLAFIDEVDSSLQGNHVYGKLLAPLWDGSYFQGGRQRPIGNAVFVLAGSGHHWSSSSRLREAAGQTDLHGQYVHEKLPDLVSRLTVDPISIPRFSDEDRLDDRPYILASLLIRRFPCLTRVEKCVLDALAKSDPLFDIRSLELFIDMLRPTDETTIRRADLEKIASMSNGFFRKAPELPRTSGNSTYVRIHR